MKIEIHLDEDEIDTLDEMLSDAILEASLSWGGRRYEAFKALQAKIDAAIRVSRTSL